MFWDRIARVYDVFASIYNGKVHDQLCRLVSDQIRPGDRVLECACGTGMLSRCIAPRCAQLTATDISENMLKKARKKCASFPNASFMNVDINALPFDDESFDVAVAANVIHLLDDPEKALAELDRVCVPGGRLIIPTYVNRETTGRTSGFAAVVGKAGADFKRQFTLRSYREFFEDLGYRDEEYTLIIGRVPCAIAFLHCKGK